MLDEFFQSGLEEIQMIVFKLGEEDYAIPITDVQEIIMTQEATRIPKSPRFVEGVINLRGNIIPILDGKKKFGLAANENEKLQDKRIMILELDNKNFGLVVDEVSEVVHLKNTDIEPPPVDSESETEFLWGVGKYQGKLLILLDSSKILTLNESQDIKNFAKASETIRNLSEQQEIVEKVK